MNTADETFILGDPMIDLLKNILRNKGLIVIGAAGFEKSIHTTFDKLTSQSAQREVLEYGICGASTSRRMPPTPRPR